MVGRIAITATSPTVSCGRYPARAVTGEDIAVSANVFREGHDAVAADVVVTAPDGTRSRSCAWARRARDGPVARDRAGPGRPVERGHLDTSASRRGATRSAPGGTTRRSRSRPASTSTSCSRRARGCTSAPPPACRRPTGRSVARARRPCSATATATRSTAWRPPTAPDVVALLTQHPLRELVTSDDDREVWVDRERALFGAWYEFFPRSEGAAPDEQGVLRGGTFRTADGAPAGRGRDGLRRRLPAADPPDRQGQPQGPEHAEFPGGKPQTSPPTTSARPGRSAPTRAATTRSTPTSARSRTSTPSSPAPRELGMEVALDFALQCAPDHPWVEGAPGVVHHRAPTARSRTPRTRRRSTRTSTR